HEFRGQTPRCLPSVLIHTQRTSVVRRSVVLRAARVAHAGRVAGPIVPRHAAQARRTNGFHLLGGAVRGVAVEDERLLELDKVAVAAALKPRALDHVEAFIGEEYRGRRKAAVWPRDAQLPAIDPVDAVRDVELHLAAALRQLPHGLSENGGFLK